MVSIYLATDQAPSAYFLTDAYLYLDILLKKRLFKPISPDTRNDMAGREGVKGKRMVGALRFLWRSAPEGAHDPRISELKAFLLPSPRRAPRHSRVSWFELFVQYVLGLFGGCSMFVAPYLFLTFSPSPQASLMVDAYAATFACRMQSLQFQMLSHCQAGELFGQKKD